MKALWGAGVGGGWGGVGGICLCQASAWRTVMDEVEGLKSSGSSLTPPPAGVGGYIYIYMYNVLCILLYIYICI